MVPSANFFRTVLTPLSVTLTISLPSPLIQCSTGMLVDTAAVVYGSVKCPPIPSPSMDLNPVGSFATPGARKDPFANQLIEPGAFVTAVFGGLLSVEQAGI